MSQLALFAIDWLAVGLLAFGLYFPRHRRRDLVVAFLCVNIGVLAVSSVLSSTAIAAGVGLGLFGVLSIIRLRSTELEQHEVAYYFSALALGLLAGLAVARTGSPSALMAMILLVIFIGDHPRMFRRYRHQVVVLDQAFPDENALIAHLEQMLGARVHRVIVQRLDLVNDTTTVEARYQLSGPSRSADRWTAWKSCSPVGLAMTVDRQRIAPWPGLDPVGPGRAARTGGPAGPGRPQVPAADDGASNRWWRHSVPGARILQIDDRRTFDYESVYFDTPDLTCYLLAAHRRRRRFKIRTRTYVDSAECWLEVKTRDKRGHTVKYRQAHDFGAPGRVDGRPAGPSPTWSSPMPLCRAQPISAWPRPWSPRTGAARCTCRPPTAGSPSTPTCAGNSTPANPSRCRRWRSWKPRPANRVSQADRLLWRSGHRPNQISKYGTGLAALRPELPSTKWHRILRRHFPAAA